MLTIARTAAVATLLGSIALAAPAFAAAPVNDSTPAGPPSTTMNVAPNGGTTAAPAKKHHGEMKDHVEMRIKTLHDKLGITADQESDWSNVAQAMRDSAAEVKSLVDERHQNEGMSAVDDLESYQKIAAAHADGMQKVIDAFKPLYDSMSDAQKQNADKVFGSYEGRPDRHHGAKATQK